MRTKILRNASGALVRAEVDDDDNIFREIEVLERAGEGVTAIQQRGASAERQVRNIAANAGVRRRASRSSAAKVFAAPCGRRDEMAAIAAIGKPRKEIAALYGVTNQEVALAIISRKRNFQTGNTTE